MLGFNIEKQGWEFPGGKNKDDEPMLATAQRELWEETGLVFPEDQWGWLGFVDNEPGWLGMCYVLDVEHKLHTPQRNEPHKHAAWSWFSMTHLPSPLTFV